MTMENFSKENKTALQNNDQALAAEKALQQLEKIENFPLTIAVTGESGSGKSTFVNALRGLKNKDKGAAPTGVVETTMEPTEYCHPQNPNIKIWDLPGVGRTKFTADEYLEHVGFEKFDFFIIVSDTRFRENDAKLAQEIQKMKKKFYFVRSKIDHNIRDEEESVPTGFNEENILNLIRNNCIEELQKLGVESPKVFLVSSFDLHLYEFKALWETLDKELGLGSLGFCGIIMDKNFKEELVKTALQKYNMALAAKVAKEYLEKLNSTPLNMAITGESGSGKSTFVNALRGLKNKDKGAAPTGVVETTMEPTEYSHPKYPNIKIWDLPGVGTTKFTAEKYLEHVGFEKFDFFIIVSNDRFKKNDAKLAQEIQKMKKKFYFVRSKIDHNIRDEEESVPTGFNEENILNLIRNNCIEELQQLGVESPKVFLVSSFDLHLYEFKALWETLEKELSEHQWDALLLALPNISLDVINQKKKTLGAKTKWYALASAMGAAVPVPGFSESFDVGIIIIFVKECLSSLGLTHQSLLKLSRVTGVPFQDFLDELKSSLPEDHITRDLVLRGLAMSATHITAAALEEGVRFVPFFGIPVAMGLSGFTTYRALNYFLNSLADDAQRVFIKALGLTTSL